MPATLTEALPFILIALLALAVAAFLLLRARRKVRVIDKTAGDVLDEGAARAARNQALIDAPTAVAKDVGPMSANANSNLVAAVGAIADAEAGASVPPPPAPAPAPAASKTADDLTRIKGLGPKIVALLAEQGVTRFDQIAGWSEADITRIDAALGRFAGRITRDQWVEQAKLLAAGDDAGFTARFGQNG